MLAATLRDKFDSLGKSDLPEFNVFFQRLRRLYPPQAAEACLGYIGAHGLNAAGLSMAFWLFGHDAYISVLLDTGSLSVETASKAIGVIKDVDVFFFPRLLKRVKAIDSRSGVLRVLALVPALGDYSILIPWLRGLSENPDNRIRARSAKLFSGLRSNKSLIEPQILSSDPRIRSGALGALWKAPILESAAMLRAAVSDPHHRVVANALVGLYLLAETKVLGEMIALCQHNDQLFRAAMAWAIGVVKDAGAMPALQELIHDKSQLVRKRAIASLLALESDNTS